jgi:hypothetical protein
LIHLQRSLVTEIDSLELELESVMLLLDALTLLTLSFFYTKGLYFSAIRIGSGGYIGVFVYM